jgi:hypothetical protein
MVIRKYCALPRILANGYFWRNASNRGRKIKSATGRWKVLASEIATFELLEPDFDLKAPVGIVANCAD